MKVTLQTNRGDIVIELNDDKAPVTVDNFVSYVRDGFYDDTIFHRVIDGFMIQGGGHEPGLGRKATKPPIKNEADNGLRNMAGTIAMARTGDPHSATAQFFINVVNNDFLNHRSKNPQGYGYAVFGKVTEGMDVVDKIRAVPTGNSGMFQDVPLQPVSIVKATMVQE